VIRACDNCRTGFSANGVWQRLCWTCWREQKDRDDLNVAYVRGYQAGLAAHNLVDADLLQAAIALCHPDRHPPERWQLANEVTARLLEARKALAA
jgi:hypothetical protein